MKTYELRDLFLRFFEQKGHAIIPSASLIPENDPTVLFTTAGMHPLVPYLLGTPHPGGKRLTDIQKCVRVTDIDEVGDAGHCTFFEMLGNWSLGDYFKEKAIPWSWEFLTSPEWLGLDKERLYFSCFAGDENAPRDTTSHDLWRSLGVAEDHIFYLPKENNWWGLASGGPCGPDTEMFYDTGKPACGPDCSPACDCGKFLEIWNDVFMEYNKQPDGSLKPLAQRNVDTGMGLDRTVTVLNGLESVFENDAFAPIIAKIGELTGKGYKDNPETTRAFRIIADHCRAATFMLGDPRGVTPSNVDQGYILRRLLRRAIRFAMKLGMPEGQLNQVAATVIDGYGDFYTELQAKRELVLKEIALEEERFQRTLAQGIREFDKLIARMGDVKAIDGPNAFRLYDTYGFPIEFTVEMAEERGLSVDTEGFAAAFEHHQELSKLGAEQRFKGGLADHSVETARLHTATHLLHAALRRVLGHEVAQKGSNITPERLRFDFSFGRKVTKDELAQVESIVNESIAGAYPIDCREMTVAEAKDEGAIGLFEAKYGERVRVYTMGPVSKEICGGPHAENTAELGHFKIQKEEASSAGVRRIKAVLIKE